MILNFNFRGLGERSLFMLREFKRVIIVSKKPDAEEIVKISKIAGIGTLLMGVIGFAIQIAFQLVLGV